MRRVIVIALLIITSFVLQTTVFNFHDLTGVSPDLLMIITMSFGIMRGRREGMLTGFFCGMLYDIFYGTLMGPYMFLYMVIGYVNGFFHKNYLMEDVMFPVFIITVDEFVKEFIVYIFAFLLRNRLETGYYILHFILPKTFYTVLMTVIIYRIYVRINKYLKKKVSEAK